MRFGSTLREKALLALEEAVQEARYRCPRRSFALRFALAFLWSQARAEKGMGAGAGREAFDGFWAALAREDMWRFGACDRALQEIYNAIGAERDHEVAMSLWRRAHIQSGRSGTATRVEGEEVD